MYKVLKIIRYLSCYFPVLLVLFSFLFGCQNNEEKKAIIQSKVGSQSDIERLIKDGLTNHQKCDSILLGLTFGLNQQNVSNYLDELSKTPKVSKEQGCFWYNLNYFGFESSSGSTREPHSAKGKILCEYFDNELYFLRVDFSPGDPEIDSYLEEVFTKKYGDPFIAKEYADYKIDEVFWICGNRTIKLYMVKGSRYQNRYIGNGNYDSIITPTINNCIVDYIDNVRNKRRYEIDERNRRKEDSLKYTLQRREEQRQKEKREQNQKLIIKDI